MQVPRVLHRPAFTSEVKADTAIALCEMAGLRLDPWQQLLVRVTLDTDGDRWAADTVCGLVARQNGKGAWLEAIALHSLFADRNPLTLWTAHQFKTSSEAFLRIKSLIEGAPDLRKRVARFNASHGDEGVTLKPAFGGGRLRFIARSKSSGRGFSPQRIIFDEAQELSSAAQAALTPSMRAQVNRQSVYTGTVPGPSVLNPEVFTGLRDRGRAGTSERLAWLEWSPVGSEDADDASGIDLDDRRVWAAANPALGFRVTLDALQSDRNELTDDDFAREALSVWPSAPEHGVSVFGPQFWERCAEPGLPAQRPSVIGVEVASERGSASIAASVGGDYPIVAAVAEREGTGWVVAEAKRLQAEYDCEVAVHGHGPASDLIPAFEAAGVFLTILKPGDYGDACAGLWDRVKEGRLRHPDQPELNRSVYGATRRNVGDRWVWDMRKSDTNVAMLKAATVALWVAAQEPPPMVFTLDSLKGRGV